jgi:DNA-binding beta-propeller fold protein YncE
MGRLRVVLVIALVLMLAPLADAAIIFETRFGPGPPGNGTLTHPFDVAVDTGGDIFVVDQGAHRVLKFDDKGKFLLSIGKPHGADGTVTDDGQLYYPHSIAIDPTGSFLYVADTHNSRIQVFSTADGAFIRKFGTEGGGDGQFNYPGGIDVDAQGNVWVADTRNQRVQKVSPTGAFLLKFGHYGSDDGGFVVPLGIAVDDLSGRVYVTDEYIGRAQAFSSTGAFLYEIGLDETGTGYLLANPDEIASDDQGSLVYVIEAGTTSEEVSVFVTTATEATFRGEFRGTDAPRSHFGFAPHGLGISPDFRELFVAASQAEGKKIFRYDLLGTPKFEVDPDMRVNQTVRDKELAFEVKHDMVVGSCNVKATGEMRTPQTDPVFEGREWNLRGPRAVIEAKERAPYTIQLTAQQANAVDEARVFFDLTFKSPDGCNGGVDQPQPVRVRYSL